jgi:hypothetical protein
VSGEARPTGLEPVTFGFVDAGRFPVESGGVGVSAAKRWVQA